MRGVRREADDRGAVAVETALVALPVLMILVGIIEMSMLVRDYVAVTSAARAGVRVAATGAEAGNCIPSVADETPCPANGVPNLSQAAADAISRAGTALPKEAIDHIMVYKANANGYPANLSSWPASCSGISNCVTYTWLPAQERFRYSGGSWDSRNVNACFPQNVDAVGVRVVAQHSFLTGVFGGGVTMSDRAIMNFEPLPPAVCAAGTRT
jgi:hypothetical protein